MRIKLSVVMLLTAVMAFAGTVKRLVKCPDCEKEISRRAAFCPHCGCPKEDIETSVKASDKGVAPTTKKQAEANARAFAVELAPDEEVAQEEILAVQDEEVAQEEILAAQDEGMYWLADSDLARRRLKAVNALRVLRSERYVVGFLRFLATQQGANGLWDNDLGASSLALLVYLAHGEIAERGAPGEFTEVVNKAIEALLNDLIRSPSQCVYKAAVEGPNGYHDKCSDKVGLFKSRDKTNYSHMIAVYALAEAYMMTKDETIEEAVKLALEPLLAGQTVEGGWYYNLWPIYPGEDQIDSSYTCWAIQALVAAKHAGIRMPDKGGMDRIEAALGRAFRALRHFKNDDGSYGYINGRKKRQHLGLTANCTLALQLLGETASQDYQTALAYMTGWEPTFLLNHKSKTAKYAQGDVSPQYCCYYLSQVRYNQGEQSAAWKQWHNVQQALYSASAIIIPPETSGYKDHKGKAQEICYWGLATGNFKIGGSTSTDKARLEKQEGTKKGRRGKYAIDELLCKDFGNHSWLVGSASRKRVISGCFTALQLTAYYRYTPYKITVSATPKVQKAPPAQKKVTKKVVKLTPAQLETALARETDACVALREKAEAYDGIIKAITQDDSTVPSMNTTLGKRIEALKTLVVQQTTPQATDTRETLLAKKKRETLLLKEMVEAYEQMVEDIAVSEVDNLDPEANDIPAGVKGKVIGVDNAYGFCIVRLAPDVYNELVGENGSEQLSDVQFYVKAPGKDLTMDSYKAIIQLTSITKEANTVAFKILDDLVLEDIEVGDELHLID